MNICDLGGKICLCPENFYMIEKKLIYQDTVGTGGSRTIERGKNITPGIRSLKRRSPLFIFLGGNGKLTQCQGRKGTG